MPEQVTSAFAEPYQLTGTYTAWVADQDTTASTTVAAGSNGAVLPQGTINVANTAAFAAGPSVVRIALANGSYTFVAYTSKGAGTLLGCTEGAGTLTTGDVVIQARVVSFVGGSLWGRTFLTPTTGAGATEYDPRETLLWIQTVLRGAAARWNVVMLDTGRAGIKHVGTGVGSIHWVPLNGLYEIPTLIGHTGADISLATNAVTTAAYQPTHMMFVIGRTNDTGWQELSAAEAGTVFPDGVVDYLGDGFTISQRGYTLARLPRAAGVVTSNVTPMFPADSETTRRKQPVASFAPAGVPMQWSVLEFIACGMGHPIAAAHGNFQALVLATGTYDVGFIDPETKKSKASHSVAYWSQRMDRPNFIANFYATASTA